MKQMDKRILRHSAMSKRIGDQVCDVGRMKESRDHLLKGI